MYTILIESTLKETHNAAWMDTHVVMVGAATSPVARDVVLRSGNWRPTRGTEKPGAGTQAQSL